MGWPTAKMWDQLSERPLGDTARWWWESENESYIYYNRGDNQWWVDGPSGAGLYVVPDMDASPVPPQDGWIPLQGAARPAPRCEYQVSEEL
eukprot:jgi/Tetstr1/434098/TSEL_023242.t1